MVASRAVCSDTRQQQVPPNLGAAADSFALAAELDIVRLRGNFSHPSLLLPIQKGASHPMSAYGRIAFITTPTYREKHAEEVDDFIYRYLYTLCTTFRPVTTGSARGHRV